MTINEQYLRIVFVSQMILYFSQVIPTLFAMDFQNLEAMPGGKCDCVDPIYQRRDTP
jgi:hypothetical protein